MTRDAKKQSVKQEAIERLRTWIKPGDTLFTQLKSVSRSGMSRVIQIVKLDCENGEATPIYLGYNAAEAMGMRYDRDREGIKIGGCGMDMGFALVYDLARTLFPKGCGCTGEGCRSNDHSNGDRDYTPHGNGMTPHLREVIVGADHWHSDGGYTLNHRWL